MWFSIVGRKTPRGTGWEEAGSISGPPSSFFHCGQKCSFSQTLFTGWGRGQKAVFPRRLLQLRKTLSEKRVRLQLGYPRLRFWGDEAVTTHTTGVLGGSRVQLVLLGKLLTGVFTSRFLPFQHHPTSGRSPVSRACPQQNLPRMVFLGVTRQNSVS